MSKNTEVSPRSRLLGPLVSLASLFLCIISLELAGYIWEARTAQGSLGWTLVGARRIQLEIQGPSDAPYYKFKAKEEYNWEGIPVQINSHGFRGPEFSEEKPAGVYRIINLGDSVAFGWEVLDQETYGRKLEQFLNQRNDGHRYEVINAGIPTLNLEAERNLLVQEALKYQPDLVVLDVTLVNDIYGSGPNISQEQSFFQWLRDHTYSWPFLTNNIRFLLARQVGPEAIPVLNPPTEESKYYPLDGNDKKYDEIWSLIEEMSAASQEAGADFVMVIFPTAYQINSANHSNVPQLVLTEQAQSQGIKYVDMLPRYLAACDEAGKDQCEGYENLLFADVWMHPNSYGHTLVANDLSNVIGSGR
jgi:hypothetical protein